MTFLFGATHHGIVSQKNVYITQKVTCIFPFVLMDANLVRYLSVSTHLICVKTRKRFHHTLEKQPNETLYFPLMNTPMQTEDILVIAVYSTDGNNNLSDEMLWLFHSKTLESCNGTVFFVFRHKFMRTQSTHKNTPQQTNEWARAPGPRKRRARPRDGHQAPRRAGTHRRQAPGRAPRP